MREKRITAEEIAFALRQNENGVLLDLWRSRYPSIPRYSWNEKKRYSELFHPVVLQQDGGHKTRACLLYRQHDSAVSSSMVKPSSAASLPSEARSTLSALRNLFFPRIRTQHANGFAAPNSTTLLLRTDSHFSGHSKITKRLCESIGSTKKLKQSLWRILCINYPLDVGQSRVRPLS